MEKQIRFDKIMRNTILKYWKIKTGKNQKHGSCADIYAERFEHKIKYFMRINDGNCFKALNDALYHIYVGNLDGKIFEGRITSKKEFEIIMKALGFNPLNK